MELQARINRALSQKIYLLNAENTKPSNWVFDVLGTTGSKYKVVFTDKVSRCSCKDYSMRRSPCKHIILVTMRVGGCSSDDIYRMTSRLEKALLKRLEKPETIQHKKCGRGIGEDCIICFDTVENDDSIECSTCGINIHSECMSMWIKKGKNVCPHCRSTFNDSSSSDPLSRFVSLKR